MCSDVGTIITQWALVLMGHYDGLSHHYDGIRVQWPCEKLMFHFTLFSLAL